MMDNTLDNNSVENLVSDPEVLLKLSKYKMPFGRFKGLLLIDLPEPYVVWFAGEGFPKGELGKLLGIVHTIKERLNKSNKILLTYKASDPRHKFSEWSLPSENL